VTVLHETILREMTYMYSDAVAVLVTVQGVVVDEMSVTWSQQ